MLDKPDLVLVSNRYDSEKSCFYFTCKDKNKGEFEYQVFMDWGMEDIEHRLVVRNNGRIIIQQ